MREITPIQAISIIIARMEKRANVLEAVRLEAYNMAILELRRYATQLRKARDFLQQEQRKKP